MKFTTETLRKAWALAKQVAGETSSRPFFGWALKEVQVVETTKRCEFRQGSWVARITGRDEQYGLKREFLAKIQVSDGVAFDFDMTEGAIYEVRDHISWKREDRYFLRVTDGRLLCNGLRSPRDIYPLLG